MDKRAIEKAVDVAGSQAELARRINVSPAFVGKMVKTGIVPAARCRQIESAIDGAVTAEQLRPDIFNQIVAA